MTTRIADRLHYDFNPKQGIVRRNKQNVLKYTTHQKLLKLIKSQNGHLVETNSHFIAVERRLVKDLVLAATH
jgi:hypothetical protein